MPIPWAEPFWLELTMASTMGMTPRPTDEWIAQADEIVMEHCAVTGAHVYVMRPHARRPARALIGRLVDLGVHERSELVGRTDALSRRTARAGTGTRLRRRGSSHARREHPVVGDEGLPMEADGLRDRNDAVGIRPVVVRAFPGAARALVSPAVNCSGIDLLVWLKWTGAMICSLFGG